MGLWEWWTRFGMDRLASAQRRKTQDEIYEGWRGLEVILGDIEFADSDDLWGRLSQKGKMDAYGKHPLVRACCAVIVQAFREATPEVGAENADGEWEATRDHPLLSLLNDPNPDYTRSQFDEVRILQRLLAGESYVWEWRNAMGQVVELWPIPPQHVKPIPAKTLKQTSTREGRLISHFECRLPGMKTAFPIPANDMLWDRFIDPTSFTGVSSPLDAAYHAYRLNEEKDNYILEMLENYDTPAVIYSSKEQMSPREKEDFRAALRQLAGKGTKKRGSALLLDDDMQAEPVQPPLRDMDWPGLSSMVESQICSAFGVPPLLVHARVAQENSPLSSPNLEAAEQVFYRGTMSALWRHDAEMLTGGLILGEQYDQSLEIRYDNSGIRALMDDMAEIATYCDMAVRNSVMTINEARKRLGLPPDDAREGVYLVPTGMIEMRDGEPVMPAPEPNETESGEEHEEEWEEDDDEES